VLLDTLLAGLHNFKRDNRYADRFMIKHDDCNLHNWTRRAVPIIAAFCSLVALRVAAASPPTSMEKDLTPAIIHHEARCPSPRQGKCVIRKPLGSSYRVLTPGVDLEDAGDHWIGDFSKARNGKTTPSLLRVMDRHEVLHEIEITFPIEPAASEPPEASSPVAAKSTSAKKKSAKAKPKSKRAKKKPPAAPGS
jgi:hypothetical protein